MAGKAPARPTLLGLPRELRDQIYEFVWPSPGYARLTQEYIERQSHDPYEGGPTFPEAVAFPYPPKEPTEASTTASDDEDEEWLDTFSASEEDEAEIQARAAGLEALEPINEEEDSTDEEESLDSDEEEDDFDYGEDEAESLILVTPLPTGLLSVNKQISKEALSVLYENTTLVLDADGACCMQFIRSLPRATRRRIRSMAITNSALMGDDGPSRRAWSGKAESPVYRADDGLTLVTPFAATLAKNLPNLKQFSLYVPWSGDEDWYCTWAATELQLMLKYDRLQQLNHVFFGEKTAKALQKDSQDCYDELMGRLGDGRKLATHEFTLLDPYPKGPYTDESRKKGSSGCEERAFVEEHAYSFAWEWADRDLDMGTCGNVQAVIACFNDDELWAAFSAKREMNLPR